MMHHYWSSNFSYVHSSQRHKSHALSPKYNWCHKNHSKLLKRVTLERTRHMSECSAPMSLRVLRPYISQIEFQESLNINQDVLCLNRDQDVLCWRQKIKPKLFLRHDLI